MADKIEVGDIVTSHYNKGYFIVEALETKTSRRYGKFRMVMKASGKLIKSSTIKKIYIGYCNKVTEEVVKQSRDRDNERWDKVLKLINPEAETETEVVGIALELKEPKFLSELGPPPSLGGKI